jgi:hypothetical protein
MTSCRNGVTIAFPSASHRLMGEQQQQGFSGIFEVAFGGSPCPT